MDNNIEVVLGSQFFDKLKAARTVKKQKKFNWTPENKKEILTNLRANLEKAMTDTNELRYKVDFLGNKYDVMLIKSNQEVIPKQAKFSFKVSMRSGVDFRGWINCWIAEEQAMRIAPDQEYVVIGRWSERTWNEKKYYNFAVQEMIALAEVNLELEKLVTPTL